MLDEHLKMTESEAVTRIQKQYQKNVAIEIESQALATADFMTSGILRQFG